MPSDHTKRPRKVAIRKGVDPKYLQNILTKDITTLEAIYDIIDNAIDAARNRILATPQYRSDPYGLPEDYSGNRILIRFRNDSITFLDNCSGFLPEALLERAFVTGSESSHSFGIGQFGIGLKRALFRIGDKYGLSTDSGRLLYKVVFDREALGGIDADFLEGLEYRSRGSNKTLLCISKLRNGVKHEINSSAWTDTVVTALARRYGLFVDKGFDIRVNGRKVPRFGPGLRSYPGVPIQTFNHPTKDNVRIYIDAGMHEEYRLTREPDYNKSKIDRLTDQYGWYFVCNDRIIKVASHEPSLGWISNWHQEYYGFVGWVRFVSESPGKLPWDTKKTLIDPNSPVFLEIAHKLQSFAETYKSANKKARQGEKPRPEDGEQRPPSDDTKKPGDDGKKPHDDMNDHNENWRTLLPPLSIGLDHPKVRALAYEAKHLPVERCYASAMLLRSLLEFSLFENIKHTGVYTKLRERVFAQQASDGRPFTDEQKLEFRPTLRQAVDWLKANPAYFPVGHRRDCVKAATKLGNHLKELNGIIHEGDLTDSGKVKIIRNDVMPLLRFLLNPSPEKSE